MATYKKSPIDELGINKLITDTDMIETIKRILAK